MTHMLPHIRISPFLPREWERLLESKKENKDSQFDQPSFWLDKAWELNYFNSGRRALWACLVNEKLKPEDEVFILKTTEGPYISSCVTETIKQVCQWSQNLSPKTKAVLVIHEFGFNCSLSMIKPYLNKGLIIIEDCAYAIGSRIEGGGVGTIGDYAIYSLTKYYPAPFGGLLASKKAINIKKLRSMISPVDIQRLKLTLKKSAPFLKRWNEIRCKNWKFFSQQLSSYHITPYFDLKRGVIPGVFLARLPKGIAGDVRKKSLNQAGVEATEYYGQGGFYFPVHQFLTDFEKGYILYHFINPS